MTRFLVPILTVAASATFVAAALPACARTSDAGAPEAAAQAVDMDAEPPMTLDAMVARARGRDYWPTAAAGWRVAPDTTRAAYLERGACKDFDALVFPPAGADEATARELGVGVDELTDAQQALRTDGLLVVKNGTIVYERYTGPYEAHPEKRHCVWSASKSVTAALLGAVIELSERKARGEDVPYGKLTKEGRAIRLDTRLTELMDASELSEDPRFGALTVEQLLAMAPNLDWRERYEGDLTQSSIIRMLWLDGPKDMAKHAAGVPFGPEGAGNKFIYSSGNAVILMRALRAVFGDAYDRMPWGTLFDKLGMTSAAFERDRTGTFVGSSYVHMNLRDLARFGYAYLNGGWFDGQQVIHRELVQKARELSLGMRAAGTSDADIVHEEGFYGLGFWINPSPVQLAKDGVRRFGPEFPKTKFLPNVPADTFFAAGHYGQNVLIFPKDDLLVVRMSHDKEYWSKLDRMMSKARGCFLAGTGSEVAR